MTKKLNTRELAAEIVHELTALVYLQNKSFATEKVEQALTDAEKRGFKDGATMGISAAEFAPLDAALQVKAQNARMRQALENVREVIDFYNNKHSCNLPDNGSAKCDMCYYERNISRINTALQAPPIDLSPVWAVLRAVAEKIGAKKEARRLSGPRFDAEALKVAECRWDQAEQALIDKFKALPDEIKDLMGGLGG